MVFDANPGGSAIRIHPETRTLTGRNSFTSKGTAANFALYFVAAFDKEFQSFGTWDESGAKDTSRERAGKHVGAYLGFSTQAGEKINVRIGTSLISLEQAERNLKAEIPSADLDKVAAAARAVWEGELSKVKLTGGTEAQQRTFYTALNHVLQFPRMLQERDAEGKEVHYSPYDGKVHPGPMFSETGFWDTFRAQFPLLTILQPKKNAEIIQAMLNAYDEGGFIPKWANPAETNVMIGTHGDSVIADAYMKGIRGYDIEKAGSTEERDHAGHGDLRGAQRSCRLHQAWVCPGRQGRKGIGRMHSGVCLRRLLCGADGSRPRQAG
jgi:predicted alpha-1,2-mannosidase